MGGGCPREQAQGLRESWMVGNGKAQPGQEGLEGGRNVDWVGCCLLQYKPPEWGAGVLGGREKDKKR